jgi:uncharacterized membrane protein
MIVLTVSSVLLLAACANSVIQSDWDQLSSSAQDEICYGVEKFGADTAAGLEYTLNSDYSKDELADFLRGKC